MVYRQVHCPKKCSLAVHLLVLDNLLDMYVSGWGKTSSDCTTDEFGPIKNLKCKLPFTYKEENLHECANVRSPSSKIEECKAFKK